eukprot:TRINITY_DN3426_c0_g1_i1.p4 TRINITY_DN3426_c0_g1~~TRINITY_DN3426_c0_g1_i1.p4  ORF type:complete len:158 (+),score=35.48 TRINITY_DN3426_c0_g1_i1:666-1139(+)
MQNDTKCTLDGFAFTAEEAFAKASASMVRLNKTGAELMHKYGAHAATDVTGFGVVGHARNLAGEQKTPCELEIDTLPLIRHMREINEVVDFNLLAGSSAETSGGLLVCLPAENAVPFCEDIARLDGCPAWVVGRVCAVPAGARSGAHIVDKPTILDV